MKLLLRIIFFMQTPTRESLKTVDKRLPFQLRGLHPDTGSEFINWFVKDWCDDHTPEKIELTRSRPYRKNDNAYIEERNGHIIRKYLGHWRLDAREVVPVVNKLYKVLGLYLNHFVSSRKCIEKVRVRLRYIRNYDTAQTPYQRVLAHPDISEEVKRKLQREHGTLNPLRLKKEIDRLIQKVFDTQKRYGSPNSYS